MSDRLALIIGNNEFGDPKLTELVTPSSDARSLAEVLSDRAIGSFDVTPLIDETLQVVNREIARLFQRKRKGDLLLLYYSGHGIKDDYGDLYLAVKDTNTDLISATAIDAASVRRQLDKSNSQRKLVILDCCHSGAFARGAKAALGSTAGTEEAFVGSGYGRVILTASNAVEYAWEGERLLGDAERSVFTHFLVEGLRTGAADLDVDGEISLDELYDYVHEQVATSGRSKQTPQKWEQQVEGQIIIAKNPFLAAKPAELPAELERAMESPLAGVRKGAVSDLDHLLRGSHKGLAVAAHEALSRLSDDDSRRVSAAAKRALEASPVTELVEGSFAGAPAAAEKERLKPGPESHPSLAIKLSAKPPEAEVGDEFTWTATVRNDSDVELSRVTVTQDKNLIDDPFDLATGKGRRFTFTTNYKTKGKKTENVAVTGIASDGEQVREKASATVRVRSLRQVAPKPARKQELGPESEVDQGLEQRLRGLYTKGLTAYWLEEWENAARQFQAITEVRPDYQDAASKLEEAKRQAMAISLYERAEAALEGEDWQEAVSALQELVSEVPDFKDAAAKLEVAKSKEQLADLYSEAKKLYEARQWRAVISVFAKIEAIEPGYTDPKGLLAAAEREASAQERLAELEDLYSHAVRAMDERRWQEAHDQLLQVQEADPSYSEAERLLARVEKELAERDARLEELYEQATARLADQDGSSALKLLNQMQEIEPGYRDVEAKQVEAQRLQTQSDQVSQAVEHLWAQRYDEAIEGFQAVEELDSSYIDPTHGSITALLAAARKAKDLAALPTPPKTPSPSKPSTVPKKTDPRGKPKDLPR